MLNEGLGEKYVPVKSQLKNRISGIADFVANLNNALVQDIFPSQYEYIYQQKKITYDYSLRGYSLSELSETIQAAGSV
jgi:hypothetical protein